MPLFDLTKEVKLNQKSYLLYRRLQGFFYLFCFSLSLLMIYLILFPTQEFNFSFLMLTSNKGNAVNPRDAKGTLIKNGSFSAKQKNYFDASLVGNFSKIKVSFTPNKTAMTSPENLHIDVRKSYRAFLFPEGEKLGFKNGTLVKAKNNYYLVSENRLRKFENETILSALGFSHNAFIEVSENDLQYNPLGENIRDTKNYPVNTLFHIKNDFYLLTTDNVLEKFISTKAFNSHYTENLAITKDEAFLDNYTIAKTPIVFADSSLVSYGLSAFIASKDKLYPIGDPDIFINQGYDWDDVIPMSGDEFAFYEKQKMFNLTSTHPDGTIFFTADSNEFYKIENGQKQLLPSEKIANSWQKKKPISVSAKSLDVLGGCNLQKEFWGNYSCFIPLNDKEDTAGKYYEFAFTPQHDLKIDNLNLLYEKNMTMQNLKLSLRNMILRIKARYGIETTPQE